MAAHDTPESRTMRARMAAHSLHAKVADPTAHTAPARKAFLDGFEREVDPDGVLPPAERARRAEHARKSYFLKLALKSAQARRKGGAGPPGLKRGPQDPAVPLAPRSTSERRKTSAVAPQRCTTTTVTADAGAGAE